MIYTMDDKLKTNSLERFDNSKHADLLTGIEFSKSNKFSLTNTTSMINYKNEFYMYLKTNLVKYSNIINENLIEIELEEFYYYKPDYLAKDLYGSADLWYLVLYCSQVVSVDCFNIKKINIFNPKKINLIYKLIKLIEDESKSPPILVNDITLKNISNLL